MVSKLSTKMYKTTVGVEYLIRILMCFTSAFQMLIVHSKHGNFCVNYLSVLKPEASWIHAIVVISGSKNIMFLGWECLSIYAKKEEDQYDVISEYDSDGTMSQTSRKSAFSHKERLYNRDLERQSLRHSHLQYGMSSSFSDLEDCYQKKHYNLNN